MACRDSSQEPWRQVVGLVRDVKSESLTDISGGEYYVPLRQHPETPLSVIVRTSGDMNTALSSIADIARSLDRDLPLFQAQTFEEAIRQAAVLHRSAASLFSVFGVLALVLASIGVYGVAAHAVSLRTREIGIRMSLGARTRDVVWLFVREGLSLSLIGVAIGLAISAGCSSILTAFLFGLTATDTMTFVGGA